MNSRKDTEKLILNLLAKHKKRVDRIKNKLSSGKYKVKNDKVAAAMFESLSSGDAALRMAIDELN